MKFREKEAVNSNNGTFLLDVLCFKVYNVNVGNVSYRFTNLRFFLMERSKSIWQLFVKEVTTLMK